MGNYVFREGTLRLSILTLRRLTRRLDAVVKSSDHIRTVIVPTTSDL